MKNIIAALALILLAAGPTFAATPAARQLHEGRAGAFVPFSGGYSVNTETSREGIIHAN